MKFDIGKKEMLEALRSVQPAVATRSTLPGILGGVRLEAVAGRLALEATDLEFAIRLQAAAETSDGHGRAVVPAKNLINAVKAISGSKVTIEFGEAEGRPTVAVACDKKSVTIEAFPVKDWPDVTAGIERRAVCWFQAADLADTLSRVILCASNDQTRPVLTGVQFNIGDDGSAELVATDSYRLGIIPLQVELMGEVLETSPIVPARVLKALAKQIRTADGRGILYVGNVGQGDVSRRVVEFSVGATTWFVWEIMGDYPNWRQIVPAESGGIFEYDSKELTTAAKGAADLRTQKSVPVRVSLGDSCVLTMTDNNVATVTEKLEQAGYSPNGAGPMEIAFNPDFLIDGITFVGEEKGRMRATDPFKPALFVSPANNDRKYVLMPVRLSS